MKKTLAIILITIFLPNHLLAKDPKSSYPTFTKWLLDNGYNQYVDIDENGVPKDLTQTGHLLVASAQNLTIRGESGTKLIMTDVYTTGVLVVDSTNVTLEQVSIDFDPLPFTQGLVESVDLENKLVTQV